jgi:TolA-binding protein
MAPLVEARRDGRVGERESASLDRHLVACTSCRELAADLERLAGLAGRPSVSSLSPLEQRRERLRLLRDAAFAPASLNATRSRVQIVRLAAAAAMVVGVLAGGTALAILAMPSAKAAPSMEASSVAAPTPFAPRTFAATIAEPTVVAPPPSAVAVVDEEAPVVAAPRSPAPRPRSTASAPSAKRIDAAKPSDGASALADGVELIERGDYGAAAERLRAFRQGHPGDVRAQDAAFLAILALERAGRHPAAVAAAREYLTSYPQGYRRAEAQAIVAAP